MGKYELKKKKNKKSVSAFINSVKDPIRKRDAKRVLKLFKEITKEKPVMWGTSIIGYGTYHYKYASGQEGDWMVTGFSPRQANTTVYIMPGYSDFVPLIKKLGPHSMGKSCLYLINLDDIDMKILKKMIERGISIMKKKYNAKI